MKYLSRWGKSEEVDFATIYKVTSKLVACEGDPFYIHSEEQEGGGREERGQAQKTPLMKMI
jgi:hypothetical protein